MDYLTIEGRIEEGRIIPLEPDRLPSSGRVLLTVLSPTSRKPDFDRIKPWLGSLKTELDAAEWQRASRAEWDTRSPK